jgi:hypothetical protein
MFHSQLRYCTTAQRDYCLPVERDFYRNTDTQQFFHAAEIAHFRSAAPPRNGGYFASRDRSVRLLVVPAASHWALSSATPMVLGASCACLFWTHMQRRGTQLVDWAHLTDSANVVREWSVLAEMSH